MRTQRHQQVGDPLWPRSSTWRVVSRIAGRLVGEHVRDPGVRRGAARRAAVCRARAGARRRGCRRSAEREDRRVDAPGVASWVTARSGSSAGWAMSSIPGGVEHLREAVEDAHRERVPERVQQPPLHHHADHTRAPVAQRGGQRVGPGVRQPLRRGAHPGDGRLGHRPLAAEGEGGGGRRDPGPTRDGAQGGAAHGLTRSGHGRHTIESIRSNRFDLRSRPAEGPVPGRRAPAVPPPSPSPPTSPRRCAPATPSSSSSPSPA